VILSPFAIAAIILYNLREGMRRLADHWRTPHELVPGVPIADGHFEDLSRQFEELGFRRLGDFEVFSRSNSPTKQRTFARGFAAPDGCAVANVYQLYSHTVGEAVDIGEIKIWADVEALLPAGEMARISNVPPGMTLFDRQPTTHGLWLPGASAKGLWEALQRHTNRQAAPQDAPAYARHREEEARKTLDFQVERGLFRREGDRYVQTAKLNRRALLRFQLPLFDRGGWRWPLKIALVLLGWAAVLQFAALVPPLERMAIFLLAGAAVGAIFVARFWLPVFLLTAEMVLLLKRDDLGAVAALVVSALYTAQNFTARRAAKVRSSLGTR
jgi:hypothetical protein